MARERKAFKLGLDPAAYNPVGLKAYSEDDIRKEYARLRREAEQRLTRLGKSEFRESEAYTQNVGRFKRLADIKDRRTLERLTQEAARFVTARSSSASGQRGIRRDVISSLHARSDGAFDWVNTKNYKKFTEFMEELRATGQDKLFYLSSSDSQGEMDADSIKELFEDFVETGEINL